MRGPVISRLSLSLSRSGNEGRAWPPYERMRGEDSSGRWRRRCTASFCLCGFSNGIRWDSRWRKKIVGREEALRWSLILDSSLTSDVWNLGESLGNVFLFFFFFFFKSSISFSSRQIRFRIRICEKKKIDMLRIKIFIFRRIVDKKKKDRTDSDIQER